MIAGQETAGHRQCVVQLLGKFEIAAAIRPVEGDIAAVDDKIRARRVDMFADAVKIVGQLLETAGEVGVGNLRQAKFAHAVFLSGPIIQSGKRRNGDNAHDCHRPRRRHIEKQGSSQELYQIRSIIENALQREEVQIADCIFSLRLLA